MMFGIIIATDNRNNRNRKPIPELTLNQSTGICAHTFFLARTEDVGAGWSRLRCSKSEFEPELSSKIFSRFH